MAPRKTQQEATATARRTTKVGSRATAVPRTKKAADTTKPKKKPATRPSPSKRASCEPSAARWWTVPAAIIAIIAIFGYTYYPVARVQYRETREKVRLQSELSALKARNVRLRKQVARLRTPEGVEDQARTQLGLVKRGEHIVVVNSGQRSRVDTVAMAVPDIDSDYLSDQPVGPWTHFLDVVFRVQ